MKITKILWDSGILFFGGQQRGCSQYEIMNLDEKLSNRLQDSNWNLTQVKECGIELWNWLDGENRWLDIIKFEQEWRLEISGTLSALTNLPWEILYNHKEKKFLTSKIFYMPVRRIDNTLQELPIVDVPRQGLSILFMAAAPEGKKLLSFEEEEASIITSLKDDNIFLQIEESGTIDGIATRSSFLDRWSIAHITCHGSNNEYYENYKEKKPSLYLENNLGKLHVITAEEFLLQSNLRNRVSLVFISACLSAEKDTQGNDSFIATLARGGIASVLGFAAKVVDSGATKIASTLYVKLARNNNLLQSLAEIRQAECKNMESHPSAWASLRYVESKKLDKLCPPEIEREPFLNLKINSNEQEIFSNSNRPSKVANRARFVGRRRALQQLLKSIEGQKYLGACIIGLGGSGKSSLVARAISRIQIKYRIIMINQPIVCQEILYRFLEIYPELSLILNNTDIEKASSDYVLYYTLLYRCFEEKTLQREPALFIFDNIDTVLEDDLNKKYLTSSARVSILKLLESLALKKSKSRLVITSRDSFFVLNRKSIDLMESLDRIKLVSLSFSEARKLLLQAELYDEDGNPRKGTLNENLINRCITIAGNHPKLLVLLHTLLSQNMDKREEVLEQVEEHLRTGTNNKNSGEVKKFMNNLALEAVLKTIEKDDQKALRSMTLFSIAIPLSTVIAVTGISKNSILRMVDLNLIECHINDLLFVPMLIRPVLTPALSKDEIKELGKKFLEALPNDWMQDSNGKWEGPLERAQFLYKICKETDFYDKPLSQSVGKLILKTFVNSGDYKNALGESVYLDKINDDFDISILLYKSWLHTNTETANKYLIQARSLLSMSSSLQSQVELLKSEAELSFIQGRPDEAILKLEIAKNTINTVDINQYAIILAQSAEIKLHKGKVEETIHLYNEALQLFKQLEKQREISITKRQIAEIKFLHKGQTEEALEMYDESINDFKKLGEFQELAITLYKKAIIFSGKNKIKESLDIYNESLNIFNSLDDYKNYSIVLSQIAELKLHTGKIEESFHIYSKVLVKFKELSDYKNYSIVLGQLAEIEITRSNKKEALDLYKEKLKIVTDSEDLEGQAHAFWKIGHIQSLDENSLNEAILSLTHSLSILETTSRLSGIAAVSEELGRIYLRTNQISNAEKAFLRSVEIVFKQYKKIEQAIKILEPILHYKIQLNNPNYSKNLIVKFKSNISPARCLEIMQSLINEIENTKFDFLFPAVTENDEFSTFFNIVIDSQVDTEAIQSFFKEILEIEYIHSIIE
jgi:tetratricopeptide (TPR) repeat protein